jgi:hypothetical protein
VRRVDVVPLGAVAFLLDKPLRVPSCHDLDVVAGIGESPGKCPRVVLHPTDSVARQSNDADPHGRPMLARIRTAYPRARFAFHEC